MTSHADELAARIAQEVDRFPPLTVEQRGRIAVLLRPPGGWPTKPTVPVVPSDQISKSSVYTDDIQALRERLRTGG